MGDLGRMLERFSGTAGKTRLVSVFEDQELVLHDVDLARRFAHAASVTAFQKGKELYIQGQADGNFAYFLISGELDLLVNDVYVRTPTPGQMLGEFPIVEPSLAHAVTIRARDDAIIACVKEDEFLSIAREHPIIWKNMARMLVRRLHETTTRVLPAKPPCVFIGHGRTILWKEVASYIANDLNIKTITYETAGHAGESTEHILEKMLAEATFAVLVLTGEDETAAGMRRARQNVVHEAGLFQGVLGFDRAIMMLQSDVEEFSNVAGLRLIKFEGHNIAGAYEELRRALENKGFVAKGSAEKGQ